MQNDWQVSKEILDAHLTPVARLDEAHEAGCYIENDLAIMDTSDGLADALYKVSQASNVSIEVNFDDIPVLPEVKQLAAEKGIDLKDWVLWGGEDFELLFFVPYFLFATVSSKGFKYVGSVVENKDGVPKVTINEKDGSFISDEKLFNEKTYNHFGG